VGTLTAVDLATGKIAWRSVLGTTRDQAPFPLWFAHGAPNLGGGVVTAGGLFFIGATTDKFFRAFDVATGEELWRTRIPFTANSSPATYRLRPDGKQYVVIAAGGHGWSESGDALIAFTLPD
jgi:quinoprotein glucose dehydrogenase